MKVLLQRVARASVEADGYVENRIGSGLVVYLAVRRGDSEAHARQLAAKVAKLKIFPEMSDPDKTNCTTIVENGNEILVILQQSLTATFPKTVPSEDGVLIAEDAKPMLDAFAEALRSEYQEEMVVVAPTEGELRVDATSEGPGFFELPFGEPSAATRPTVAGRATTNGVAEELRPDVGDVTRALQKMPQYPKNRATLESCRIFRVFGTKQFRSALSDAAQQDSDLFAEALDGAARFFSAKQQEQIQAWTGLALTAAPRDEVDEDEDQLDERLAELESDVSGKKPAIKKRALAGRVKQESYDDAPDNAEEAPKSRPDWRGRAAPDTPAGVASRFARTTPWSMNTPGRWNAQRPGVGLKGAGKGKGPRPWRSYGIASLDESSRLHGTGSGDYGYGQLARYSDKDLRLQAKEEPIEGDENSRGAKRAAPGSTVIRLPKGTPTVAPMTPAPAQAEEEL